MKIILSVILAVSLYSVSFAQTQPSKKLPPVDMLRGKPGDVKHIYELPDSAKYAVHNQKGKLVESGNAEFIDYTKYKPGTYFIRYNGVTETFEKKKKR